MSIFPIMCRICEKKLHLIDISIASNQHYLNMFLACADVTFRSDDKLPKHLCRLCVLRLVHFNEFKQKCEETQTKLEDQLSTIEINCRSPLAVDNETNVQEDTDSLTEEDSNNINDADEFRSVDAPANNLPKLNYNRRDAQFKCDICRKTYKFKVRLEKHFMARHNMEKNRRQCEICYEPVTSRNYTRHLAKHEEPSYCEICNKGFSFRINMLRHIKEVHENQKPFKCEICGLAFAQKSVLKTHISGVHLNEPQKRQSKSCVCEYCGILCKSYSAKYAHVQTHATERLFKCDLCEKAFKTKNNLYLHKMIHTKERKYKCDACEKAFLSSIKLKYHHRVHTGEKPFTCDFCGKGFALKTNCVTHRRLHTGEKPFKCEQCTECFIDLNGLKRHRKKSHDSL